MEEEKLIIDVETEEERRIDQFLADQMEYSRSFIQKLIKNEKVTVNGNVITKVKYPVSFRDKIIIEIPAPTELEIKPEKMDLDILYEDNGCHVYTNLMCASCFKLTFNIIEFVI